jgi:hypothetical protein
MASPLLLSPIVCVRLFLILSIFAIRQENLGDPHVLALIAGVTFAAFGDH